MKHIKMIVVIVCTLIITQESWSHTYSKKLERKASDRVSFPSYYTLDWMLTHPMGCFTTTNIPLDRLDPKLSQEKLFDRMEFQVTDDNQLEYVGWQLNMHYRSTMKNTPQPLRIVLGCIYDSSDLEHII